jgi:hypothetical protein
MFYSETTYLSSRGILNSCTIHSENPISSSDNLDYLKNIDFKNKEDNISIYVCNTAMKKFINRYLSKITIKFFLVSGDSDESMPYEVLNESEYLTLMNNENLLKWFCQNFDQNILKDNKIIQLPIGLDYHTIFSNKHFKWNNFNEGILPIEQELLLRKISNETTNNPKIVKIFNNSHFALDRFKTRQKALEIIPKNLLVNQSKFISRSETWKEMTKYKFVLSPYGNGYDCHRTYEALVLNCIPIILSKHIDKMIQNLDLPVLIVNNWNEITSELLIDTAKRYNNVSEYSKEKITLSYWINKINVNVSEI